MNSRFQLNHVLAVAMVASLTGCASSGDQGSGFGDAANNVGGALQGAASGLGAVVGSVFQPYRNGVQVPKERLAQLTVGMPASEVEALIGHPPEITSSNGEEIWSYPYSEIPHFGRSINETTVVRFDTAGRLAKAYKTNTRSSASGNPLLDAANGSN